VGSLTVSIVPPAVAAPATVHITLSEVQLVGHNHCDIAINTGSGDDVQEFSFVSATTIAQVAALMAAAWSNPDTTVAADATGVLVTPKAGVTISALAVTFDHA
jgi:hypothetical protein